ncbi:hypothetical protein ACEPAI_8779 [Sanghuangporus weigelae]
MFRFPPEILSHIFSKAVPGEDRYRDFRECIKPPLRISQVCRVWRDIAISDGRLWSYLFIDRNTIRFYKHAKEVFDTWLERSKGASLNYRLEFDHGKRFEEAEFVALDMIKALVSQQHRWGNINIDWYPSPYVDEAPDLCLANMPMLTSLSLSVTRHSRFSIDFSKSSRLRAVKLHGDFDLSPCDESLRLLRSPSTLTFLRACLRDGAIRSCLNFMEAAPFLEELHITFHGPVELPTSLQSEHESPVLVPALRRLILSGDCRSPESLLDYVILPSLNALMLWGEALVNFFKRSLPPLTFLVINYEITREDTVLEILRLLPTLKDFRYLFASVSTLLFRELTVADHRDLVCPALETLYLQSTVFSEDRALCIEALISMLESRAQIKESFRTLKFIRGGQQSTKLVSALRDTSECWEYLEQAGLFVSPFAELPPFPSSDISIQAK